mmetsp:Transcript_2485/g.9042  ORF Transcript_2485/g.9042 Transcript_2485/m.9042 type:complete len:230 (+) Transcript_2485:362-1051(+)
MSSDRGPSKTKKQPFHSLMSIVRDDSRATSWPWNFPPSDTEMGSCTPRSALMTASETTNVCTARGGAASRGGGDASRARFVPKLGRRFRIATSSLGAKRPCSSPRDHETTTRRLDRCESLCAMGAPMPAASSTMDVTATIPCSKAAGAAMHMDSILGSSPLPTQTQAHFSPKRKMAQLNFSSRSCSSNRMTSKADPELGARKVVSLSGSAASATRAAESSSSVSLNASE